MNDGEKQQQKHTKNYKHAEANAYLDSASTFMETSYYWVAHKCILLIKLSGLSIIC